ncbi:MAG: hypothetical protein F4039_09455 [Gammaproteobacteria bacterium]|nr:hypothetical protein [Gammaproteobacteria bacterium]MYK44297.1 hypothetical protein [Gammaproteobacteria bacterium]
MNLYGENGGVNGFNTGNCQGVSLWAPSLEKLEKSNKQDGWDFKSYNYERNTAICYAYTEATKPKPAPDPDFPDNSGGSVVNPSLFDPIVLGVSIVIGTTFDEIKHKVLLSYWKSKIEDIDAVQNLTGHIDGTQWSNETPHDWNITTTTEAERDTTALGSLRWELDPVVIDLYSDNLEDWASDNDVLLADLVMQVQIEEHMHSLQLQRLHDEEDRDYNISDHYAFETEAKVWLLSIASYIFKDGEPPLLMKNVEHPADFDDNRKRFNELHPNADSLEGKELQKYQELKKFFTDLSEKYGKYRKGRNPNYKKSDIK